MGNLRHVPDFVCVDGKWRIENFRPADAAIKYDDVRNKCGILYVIGCNEFHKLGFTLNFEKRIAQFDSQSPYTMTKVATRRVPYAGMVYGEAWMHKQVWDKHIKNEWFAIDREQAVALVKRAEHAARLYAQQCELWWLADQEHRRQPEVQEKLRREYERYLARFNPAELEQMRADGELVTP